MRTDLYKPTTKTSTKANKIMSIAAQLAENDARLRDASVRLLNMCTHASASDILDDIEYKKPDLESSKKSEFAGLSLFQLNAQLQDTEAAISQLNDIWLTKSLIQEIRMLFNPVGDDHYLCDKNELYSILLGIKKLKERVGALATKNLAISPALQACAHDLTRDFSLQLKALLQVFIPSGNSTNFTIRNQIDVNGSTFLFPDYIKLTSEYEAFASTNDITEELNKNKAHWDLAILDRLIQKKNYLDMEATEHTSTIVLTDALPPRRFLSRNYFQSLRNFVAFINGLHNQTFKNYYSTKISNNLVEVVSENIKTFMDNKQQLTEELVETLDFFSKNGWNMPIRNTFNSLDKILEGLQSLYVGWVTDKYINEVREVFNGPSYDTNLSLLKDVADEVQPMQSRGSDNWNQAGDDWNEEGNDWDDSWGSDDEKNNSEVEGDKAESNAEEKSESEGDDWDENWDDGWDDDTAASPVKPSKLSKIKKVKPLMTKPSPSKQISIKYSQLPFKFSVILSKFAKESNNADPRDILDTIGALGVVSYPPLDELFLLLNDFQRVKAGSTHLNEVAEEAWDHVKQHLFDEITNIITNIDFSNRDSTPDYGNDNSPTNLGSQTLKRLVGKQFDKQLAGTNTELFKVFIMELLNYINNLVLEIIVSSDEISEYQSEKYTNFIESLHQWEAEYLARVDEETVNLATYNKTKQALTLINSHLKDIMEYFYQGELYDFTTEELIKVIKSVFVPSDLRENCIGDIIEIRNS